MQSSGSNVRCSYSGELMYDPQKILKLYIGVDDRKLVNLDLKRFEYSVEKVILHEKWDGSGASFPDLALLRLTKTVRFVTDEWGSGQNRRLVSHTKYSKDPLST